MPQFNRSKLKGNLVDPFEANLRLAKENLALKKKCKLLESEKLTHDSILSKYIDGYRKDSKTIIDLKKTIKSLVKDRTNLRRELGYDKLCFSFASFRLIKLISKKENKLL